MQYTRVGKNIEPLKIDASTALLLYPAYISTPLKLTKTGHIVSMIGGDALHVINEIQAPDDTLVELLRAFRQPSTALHKNFFIKRLICKDGIYENVAFEASRGLWSRIVFKVIQSTSLLPHFEEHEVQVTEYPSGNTFDDDALTILDEGKAENLRMQLVREAMPSTQALYNATGGQQDLAMLEQSVHEKLPSMPTSTISFQDNKNITMKEIKKYALEQKPLIIASKEDFRLYAAYIPVPVQLKGWNAKIVSKINGKAIHIFDDINATDDLREVMSQFQQLVPENKVIFIRKLKTIDDELENVVFEANKKAQDATIIVKNNGKYYKLVANPWINPSWRERKEISDEEAISIIAALVQESLPDEKALYQATAGQQTREMLMEEVSKAIPAIQPIKPIDVNKIDVHGTASPHYIAASKEPLIVKADGRVDLYDASINVPVTLIDVKPGQTHVISMFEGNAVHILSEVHVDVPFEKALNVFMQPEKYNKTFIIRKLICEDGIFENVIFQANKRKGAVFYKVVSWSAHPALDGMYMHTVGMPYVYDEARVVNAQYVHDAAKTIISESMPPERALEIKTNGQQTTESLQKKIDDVLASLHV